MNKSLISRRDFIGFAAGAGFAAALPGCRSLCSGGGTALFGCCCGLKDVASLADLGYDFWENGVGSALSPDKDAAWWKTQRAAISAAPLPLRSCNGFLPGRFRLTGPDASFDAPLAYAETACHRADEVGQKVIVFGSGGARNAPDGFPKAKAVAQFTDFCKRLADRIADCRVSVVLEPLQPKEANFLNFVTEGLAIVDEVQSPRIRCLADIYHMMQGEEGPASIVRAGSRLLHCHIAEKGTRRWPGADGCDFTAYFAALKKSGYAGGISCECGWPKKSEERPAARAKALAVMKEQYARA